jgi:hypothetical protein
MHQSAPGVDEQIDLVRLSEVPGPPTGKGSDVPSRRSAGRSLEALAPQNASVMATGVEQGVPAGRLAGENHFAAAIPVEICRKDAHRPASVVHAAARALPGKARLGAVGRWWLKSEDGIPRPLDQNRHGTLGSKAGGRGDRGFHAERLGLHDTDLCTIGGQRHLAIGGQIGSQQRADTASFVSRGQSDRLRDTDASIEPPPFVNVPGLR